ncbi:hypothetical protein C8Q80DRAFT_437469 [Daedaleopsis nitida]|nr:hypothetical protein C8Q80DRAFT_437469 [Daedaleopsis nitida]
MPSVLPQRRSTVHLSEITRLRWTRNPVLSSMLRPCHQLHISSRVERFPRKSPTLSSHTSDLSAMMNRQNLFLRLNFHYRWLSPKPFLATVLRSNQLRPYLSSTYRLTFDDCMGEVPSILHHLASHLPHLEIITLAFESFGSVRPSPHPSTFTVLSGFPALHTLKLRYCTFPSFKALCHMLSAVVRLATLELVAVNWPPPKHTKAVAQPYRAIPGRRPAIVDLAVDWEAQPPVELFQWLCTTSTTRSIKLIAISSFCTYLRRLW